MKKKINTKSKSKSKAKHNVIIHNENKVIIHSPKRKRSYRRKTSTNTAPNNYAQPNYPVISYFNQEPPRKETQNELLKMAESYISPPQIMNTQNQEEEKDIRHIENNPVEPKLKPFRIKTITEQIHKKPNVKIVDIDNPRQLKKLGVKQLRELGKANGVSDDILKQINGKSKHSMIDEHFKNVNTNNSSSLAGGAVLHPKRVKIRIKPT